MIPNIVFSMQIESLQSVERIISELLYNGYTVRAHGVYKAWPSEQVKYWEIEYWKTEEKDRE